MLLTKEHYEAMNMFDTIYKTERLDKEKSKELWKIGQVYEDGAVNNMFKSFLHGYQYHKSIS